MFTSPDLPFLHPATLIATWFGSGLPSPVLCSLAIWEKALGPDHPDVALSLNNLAELYGAKAATARRSCSTSAPLVLTPR